MGRVVKFFLMLVGGFIALFIVAAIALYLFFDPNDFRDDISRTVKNQTGRDLVIDGDISLDVFPWLAVRVGKASLGNAAGFGDEPMASFDSASFSVRLLPAILRQEVVVGAADFDALRLNLQVDKRGDNNWSDLVPEETTGDTSDGTDAASDLDINSVEIINAKITYADAESGDTIIIDQANLKLGRLKSDGSAVPVEAMINFDVQPSGFVGAVSLSTSMMFDAGLGELRLNDVSIEGSVEGVAAIPTGMRVSTDGITLSTAESKVEMQTIDLELLDMHIVAAVKPFSYADELRVNADVEIDAFSPRGLMHLFDVEPPVTADPSALTNVIVSAAANVTPAAIQLSGVSIKLDDTSFTGSLSVPRTTSGFYQFELAGDSIDLNRYMEPSADGGSEASSDSVPVEIPVDLIAPLNARGKLTFSRATLGNIVFENVDLSANTSGGKMRIFPISSGLFGGTYNGDVRIDVSAAVPQLSMNEKIEGVDLAQLAKAMFDQDNVTGKIGGSFQLAGSGADMNALQRDLAGNMSMQLINGSYEGTDVWYELRRARALLKREEAPQPVLPAKTEFSSVSVSGVVTDGVMRSDDLYAELPFLQLTGKGTVDLAAATLDYGMTARVLERPEFLRDATPEELDEFTEAVIPLRISGPIYSPNVVPDVEALLKQKVEEEIEDLLKDKLKGLFD